MSFNFDSLIDALRGVLGSPSVYVDGVLDYGLLSEYLACVLIVLLCISFIFKIILTRFK